MESANLVAYVALIVFAPVAVAIYGVVRPTLATAAVLLGAVMYLPERVNFDPPGLPPFDKATIGGLAALVGSALVARRTLTSARPGRGFDLFALLLIAGTLGTALTNPDALTYGSSSIQALTPYDAVSDTIRDLLYLVFPFFLGRALYRSARDLRDLMGVVVMGALLYSPLVLIELWLSPQLHRWIYGFHQHDFSQVLRDGGYRPMVFMENGLALARLLLTAALFAATLARAREKLPFSIPPAPVAAFLTVLLLACHSMGAAVYLLVCLPLLILARPRVHVRVGAMLATVVLAYPVLRAADLFPVKPLLDVFARFSQDRADSLAFRFDNEAQLVQKALERVVFGWGGFARAHIFGEWGKDISVTDGQWIIAFGDTGAVGFLGLFGMLVGPVVLAWRRITAIPRGPTRVLVAGMALTTALNVVDLLPNGLYSALPLFYAGALAGVTCALSNDYALEGGVAE